jgi:hypothetical protein
MQSSPASCSIESCSQTFSINVPPLEWETKFHTHIKEQVNLQYILNFKFLDSKQKDKRFWIEWQQACPEFNLLIISF